MLVLTLIQFENSVTLTDTVCMYVCTLTLTDTVYMYVCTVTLTDTVRMYVLYWYNTELSSPSKISQL